MPFAELYNGATLHYEDSGGSGIPVILLHGLLGTARRDLGNVIDWLSPHYRTIGVTLRGYGESLPKPRTFPVDFYQRDAEDVLALMEMLDINDAHIMGYSDGGETAVIAAGKQPVRFRSVTVWGAVGYFGPMMRTVAQRMYPGDWITQEERELHGIPDVNTFVLDWIQAVKTMIDAGGDVSLTLATRITCPLLLMLGEHDTLNPVEYARYLIARVPGSRLETFNCGHPVHNEAWDEFKQVVGQFLAEVDNTQPVLR